MSSYNIVQVHASIIMKEINIESIDLYSNDIIVIPFFKIIRKFVAMF